MSEDFLMEVMSMNELIFAGDREDEQTRHRMIILKADLGGAQRRVLRKGHRSLAEGTAG
ncbi:hypothetical protein AGDE_11392 [Angomonas deanei]|nr:hypothetical protein AGDE_11392 [Angomonas deanei]|eukprot:EPY26370.1 hypothetical protein AGDE_11392 [Angomonas deanei]